MNFEFYISKRLFTAKEGNNTYTRPILLIAILAIALSLSIMIISVMIVTGFKKDITNKVIGFTSHITISKLTKNQSYESSPIVIDSTTYSLINSIDEVKKIQPFATKSGIIKHENEILGAILKGVGRDFNLSFFKKYLTKGSLPKFIDTIISNEVIISQNISNKLNLTVGDFFVMYFVNDPPRARKFKISGVYQTGFNDLDDLIVIADLKQIQKLNLWNSNQIGGLELIITDFNNVDRITNEVYAILDFSLTALSAREKMPHIFDWLELQDVNVKVILFLMFIVALINMVTALLILILERTQLIGVLKAVGASNWSIRKIFLYNALNIIIKGLIVGNILGIGLGYLQSEFSIISLNPDTYYMSSVPINIDFKNILLINLSTIFISYLVLIIPSFLITRISPINAIRFV